MTLRNNWRIQIMHQRKFSHNQEEKSAQDDASGDQDIQVYEESEPELPERGYLEYILLRLNLT